MSKRTERRIARKLAYQQSRQQSATAPVATTITLIPEPISEAQLQANKANAQLSTGPMSSEGKAISARNNIRHGLTSEPTPEDFRVLPSESQTAFDQNLAGFRAEWKPITATEHDLVHRLAMHQWLRRRALRLQNASFHPQTGEITDVKKFELYRRYETAHERGFNKAFADIQRLRSFQMRERNGFESQRRKNEEHEFKIRRLQSQETLTELRTKTKQIESGSEPPLSTSENLRKTAV